MALPALPKAAAGDVRRGTLRQVLHVGPLDEEGPTIDRLHAFIAERGQLAGEHHEIYLSDTRHAAPERWKTILRQPMR